MNEVIVEITDAIPEITINVAEKIEIVAFMENATPEIVIDIIGTGPQGQPGASAEALTNQEIDELLNNFV